MAAFVGAVGGLVGEEKAALHPRVESCGREGGTGRLRKCVALRRRVEVVCNAEGKEGGMAASGGRRDALQMMATVVVGSWVGPAFAAKKDPLGENLASICMCERVMQPVGRYIDSGLWDKARTNINYCTRVLRLKSVMKNASNSLEDPLDGIGIMAEASNTFSQLDASVYTAIFIPTEDGISPEQKKYQGMAFDYLKEANAQLRDFLALYPNELVERAREVAKTASYEIKVEER